MIFTTACTIIPKLDENACDYILIILLHDLYHETACQERLAKILLYNIGFCAPPTFLIARSRMRDMPIGHNTLHVSVRFVLHKVLGLFLTCSLE